VFERFTERARQVVVLAQEEARALSHNYIGTEHILLGLLREDQGIAARALASVGITVERVRAQVVRIVGAGEEATDGQIPFTPRAKKVLELALREALSLSHNYIGTEHILLGLIRENEGVAARILLDFDADSMTVRNAVIGMLAAPGNRAVSVQSVMGGEQMIGGGLDPVWLDGLGPGLDRVAGEIRSKLGRDPDAGDLLLALACAPDMLPAQALSELGVDLDALWGTLERARTQAAQAREQTRDARRRLAEQIHELHVTKERAIEDQQFERAADLRDQERQLTEEHAQTHEASASEDEALHEIRRRLGIPQTDNPPQPS
jgi:ATP-dependent Clp protease ATP-binding subunit ClpA